MTYRSRGAGYMQYMTNEPERNAPVPSAPVVPPAPAEDELEAGQWHTGGRLGRLVGKFFGSSGRRTGSRDPDPGQ